MKFFRRTSAGSRSSSCAIRSMVRSMQNADSGPPAPRYAPVGGLLVSTPSTSTRAAGVLYGPMIRWLARYGGPGVEFPKYAPASATIQPYAQQGAIILHGRFHVDQ